MDRYTEQLIQLQPPGIGLPTDEDSHWVKILAGTAQEYERIHGRIDDLANEVQLLSGTELLSEWEAVLGLPDPCAPPPTDPDLRRQRIRAKLAETGGQSAAYFIGIANALGITVDITQWQPFEIGISGMGDPVGGGEQTLVWQMNFLGTPDAERVALIKCIVSRAAPAHTLVLFSTGGTLDNIAIYYSGQAHYNGEVHYSA